MNRVQEYVRFTVGFVGLGYIALWPLIAHDNALVTFEASFVCVPSIGPAGLICDLPHAMRLPPGLHLIGLLSAVYVVLSRLLRRFRWPPVAMAGEGTTSALTARMSGALRRPFAAKPVPPLRRVKPRTHFGLRNASH